MSDTQIAGYIVFSHVERPTQTKRVPFYIGENTIGRDPSNRVPIPDATISKVHAKLIVTPREMQYMDVSKNGTKLIKNNEENKIESHKPVTIFAGMTMYLGDIVCVVQRNEVKNSEQTMTLFKPQEQRQQMKDKVLSWSDSQGDVMQLLNQKKKEQMKQPQQLFEKKTENDSFSLTGDFYDEEKKGKAQKKKEKDTKKAKNLKEQKKQVVDENKKVEENIKNKKKGSKKIIAQKSQKQEDPKNNEKKQDLKPINKQTKQQKAPSAQRKTRGPLQKERQQKMNKQKEEQKKKEKQVQDRKRKERQSLERKEKQQQKKLKQQKEREKSGEKQKQKKRKSRQKSRQPQERLSNSRRSERKPNAQQDQSTKRRISRKRIPVASKSDSQLEFYPLRRSFVNKRVLVSGFSPNLTKKYFLIVQKIEDEFDYLVMKEYKRTFKALYAICKGIDILRYDWIIQSQFLQKTLKPQGYIFKQASYIYQSIHKVNLGFRVFKGFQFYLGSEEYHLKSEDIQALIYAGGGELMKKIGKLSPIEKESKNKMAIIRNYEQKTQKIYEEEMKRIKKIGFEQIYTVEMILDSCERQLIDWQKNRVK